MSTKPVLVPEPINKFELSTRPPLTLLERAALHRGDPRSMVFSLIGAIWVFYFLWAHDWLYALASVIVSAVFGRLFSINLDEERFAQTILGKIMLLHLHPVNLAIQTMGAVFLVYGVWIHSPNTIMVGSSVIILGHLWGWQRVHRAF